MDMDEVLPRLFVGSYPESSGDIDRMQTDEGISAVLSLQTDEDHDYLQVDWPAMLAHYESADIAVRQVPVRDFDWDDLTRRLPDCVDSLAELMDAGHTVFVHCTAGVGRSPTVVAAYLHWSLGEELEEAVTQVKNARPSSPSIHSIQQARRNPPDEKT